ncbi:MAG: GNAT family N-acetyltransferase [Ruminococcus sp.]|nr:GNAT family N-acetyltransferase [Ruminococcus sp.]
MTLKFRPALESDIDSVFSLIAKRVYWMDKVGIRQWNATDYLRVYPREYYLACQKNHELYLYEDNDVITGVFVLFDKDVRWKDNDEVSDACYLHNLATDPAVKGLGRFLITKAEEVTVQRGKRRLRLDCAVDNPFLNEYYEEMGYKLCGECIDDLYIGNLREKFLVNS